jgi:hypothetical protein
LFKAQSLRSHLPFIKFAIALTASTGSPTGTAVNAKTAKKEEGVGKKKNSCYGSQVL